MEESQFSGLGNSPNHAAYSIVYYIPVEYFLVHFLKILQMPSVLLSYTMF